MTSFRLFPSFTYNCVISGRRRSQSSRVRGLRGFASKGSCTMLLAGAEMTEYDIASGAAWAREMGNAAIGVKYESSKPTK